MQATGSQAPYSAVHTQGVGAAQSCSYCHGFMNIPPLIHASDGRTYINPDFDMVKKFHLAAEPFRGTVAAGAQREYALTVPAEENHLGDLLINELLILTGGAAGEGYRDLTFEIVSMQSDKIYSNAPVFNSLVFGNAQLSNCLPCCFLIQATNSVIIRVNNTGVDDATVAIVARGKRFLPYHQPELRGILLSYWNSIPSTLFYLTLDDVEVDVAAGATVAAQMTVPGGGDFEIKWPRCEVIQAGALTDGSDIDVTVAEGIGRQWQNIPIPLGSFVAAPTLAIAGFPGGIYRASAAGHCPPFTQLFKRNTRVRHTFTNNSGTDATIRLTYAGCMHYVGECPPGRDLQRIRSLEPTIGPLLVQQRDYCPPSQQYEPMPGQGLVPIGPVNHQPLPPAPTGGPPLSPPTFPAPGGSPIPPPNVQPQWGYGYGAGLPGGYLAGGGHDWGQI